ncbi:glycosyltransferase, family 2 [Campylobacter subantarcticus LMG 24377]|uniref:Glycosyltransferase family 2 protein n=1 Tax=Campylobacter subantarcticus TaxID=497724 RepID=A0ABW9N656_9BACT|nr:glycosyltransferase family 2 protein [Campylobacter subantarcticus]AJC93021.1 glycosyltransferase, family 2 [Campylobacter subantarcticus LMG 24377]EAL3938917.1 glycosyl transferase family 2 [Campylobacter lari]MPB99747.1 glycosyltransferase family 2 protein [Campylobacter subantarcticus]
MNQISIILPTYNVEKYIARALESCINQTFKDIEIIVVDDCGNDKSIDIAKEYANKDGRIKIIHNEKNLKLLRARYEGVKVATSPYIMFLDPDDYLELNACEECINLLFKKEKNVDLIWFNFLYDKQGAISKDNFLKDKFYTISEYCQLILKQKNNICYWNLCSKLIKKQIYLDALLHLKNQTKLTMAEDALVFFFIILNCKTIITSSKNIYYYFQNCKSSVNTKDIAIIQKNLLDEKKVIDLLQSFFKNNKNNIDKNICKLLRNLIIDLMINNLHREIKKANEIKKLKLKFSYIPYKCKKTYNKTVIKYYMFLQFLAKCFNS